MDVKTLFDHASADYDRTRRQYIPCFDDFYGMALELIPYERDADFRVLDVGAGTGLLSALLLAAFPNARLTLVDLSPEMLGKAQARFADRKDIQYDVLDVANNPLPGQYDVVMSALALHHIAPPGLARVFRNVFDVLAPDGIFINADQALGTSAANEQRYQETWLRGIRAKGCSEEDIAVALERIKVDQTSPLDDQLRWLREAGFVDVDVWYKNYRFAVYSGRKP